MLVIIATPIKAEDPPIPQGLIDAARHIISRELRQGMSDEEIDEAVDLAQNKYRTWIGEGFNLALLDMGLIESTF